MKVKLPVLMSVVAFMFCVANGAVFAPGGHSVLRTAIRAKLISDCLNFGTSEITYVTL